MLGQVHGETGLAHRRTAGDDDQISRLQPGRLVIEIDQPGPEPGNGIVRLEQGVDLVQRFGQQAADGHEALLVAQPRLGNLEHLPLGCVDQLRDFAPLWLIAALRNISADANQLAQDAAGANDGGIGGDVGRAWGIPGQHPEIGQTAHAFQIALPLQPLGNGDHITGLDGFGEMSQGTEDQPVR